MIQTNEHPVAASTWRFPERLVSWGTRLLTQQCWNWGCDVRRPEGNLLLEAGFTRVRPPTGVTGNTLYALHPSPETQIILWSFGIFFGQAASGGLLLNRFRFAPHSMDTPTLPLTIWTQEHLPPLHRPAAADRERLALLLAGLLDWISAYESTVLAEQGVAYREACLAQWSRRKLGVPAAELPARWAILRGDCADALAERAAA